MPVVWLRKTIAFVLLVLWVPATTHCQIESILEAEILSCCTHEDASSGSAHHGDDCAADECAVVESGLYKVQDQQVLVPDPPQALIPYSLGVSLSSQEDLDPWPLTIEGLAPPDLAPSWLFAVRAAPAPRAPSA